MKKRLLQKILVWFVIFLLAPSVTRAATFLQGTKYVEYGKTTTVTLPDYLIDEYNNHGAVPYSGGGTLSWSVSNSSLIIEGTDHFSCRIRPRSGSTFPSYVKLTASFRSWYGTTLMETMAEWTVKLKTEEKIHANCISINHYSFYLGLGEKKQKQLVATVFPEDSEDKTVTWTSSNENVATVSNDGVVTAIAEGAATITCEACDKVNNAKTFCEVTVTEDDPVEQNYVFNDGTGVKEVSNSRFHTLIVKEDGTLWACGANSIGQLGDGTKVPRFSPVFIMDNVATVATSSSGSDDETTSFVVKTNGDLWAWGYNHDGRLGDGSSGSKAIKYAPVKIMEGVSSIYAGTFIIKDDGSLWGCGNNSSYSLGEGTGTDRSTPVKILDNVRSVVKGLAVTDDGDLWAWGKNEYGEVGDGTTTERKSPVKIMENVASITAGNDHSMALKKDGTLWTWGRNNYGQLGDGTTTDRQTPVKIADNVSSIASGTVHSLFIKNDGSLWTCGYNNSGQLGNGSYKNQSTPVKVMEDVAYIPVFRKILS